MAIHKIKATNGKEFSSRIEAILHFANGKILDDLLNNKEELNEIVKNVGNDVTQYYVSQILKRKTKKTTTNGKTIKKPSRKKTLPQQNKEISETVLKELELPIVRAVTRVLRRMK